jgi:hypothetical protein
MTSVDAMGSNLKKAIQAVLRADAEGLNRPSEQSPDWFFVHRLVNYARAKQESAKLLTTIAACGEGRTEPDVPSLFQALIKQYVPRIDQKQIHALYEAIERDNQS